MSIANTETALFVSMQRAIEFCHAACSRADVRTATPHRRYRRGELQGYWINLKMTDGTLQEMSEDYAEGLAG